MCSSKVNNQHWETCQSTEDFCLHLLISFQEWRQDGEEWTPDLHQNGQYWSWGGTVSPSNSLLKVSLSYTLTYFLIFVWSQTSQSRRGAVVGSELWANASIFRRQGGFSRVPALRVQWGQPALLVGLWGAKNGDQSYSSGWEGQDHIRRLCVHIITQRGKLYFYWKEIWWNINKKMLLLSSMKRWQWS